MVKKGDKIGIKIIGFLFMLVAIVFFIVGILCQIPSVKIPSTSIIGEIWQNYIVNLPYLGSYLNKLTPFLISYMQILGIVLIILGIILAIDSIGLFKLKKWAHSLAVLLSIIAIIVLLGIIFVWYLLKSDIKEEFGKS
ncbi:MAG: hypothetical protein ACTSXT_05245 [Candidatus Helarchaeota archaeon]